MKYLLLVLILVFSGCNTIDKEMRGFVDSNPEYNTDNNKCPNCGKWVNAKYCNKCAFRQPEYYFTRKCSLSINHFVLNLDNYCPDCGAKTIVYKRKR